MMALTEIFNNKCRKGLGSLMVLSALAVVGTFGSKPAGLHRTETAQREVQLLQAQDLLGNNALHLSMAGVLKLDQVDDFVHGYVSRSIKGQWKNQSPRISRAILAESQRHGFDPLLLLAVIQNESRFDPSVIGSHGEIGLMQIKPDTAEWIANKIRTRWNGPSSLHDPIQNVRLGAAYLALLREEFGYSKDLYLSAYNMGSKNVRRILSSNSRPNVYAQKTTEHYSKIYLEFMGEGQKSIRNQVSVAAL